MLDCTIGSLYTKEYRQRLGLPAIRVGRHYKFDTKDIERAIEGRKEKFTEEKERGKP
jgi:hypothetical protein